MSNQGAGDIRRTIRQQLGDLEKSEPPERLKFIHQVLEHNLDNGRLQKVLSKSGCDVEDYITRVITSVSRWQIYANELQVKKSEEAWQVFLPKLRQWAYRLFYRWGAFLEYERSDEAREASVDGATEILTSDFPFDVEFEPWAYNLQRNVCRRHVRESVNRANDLASRGLELDTWDWWDQSLSDPRMEPLETEIWLNEVCQKIPASISKLVTDQQHFIQLYYFVGLTYSEIECTMNKCKNTLYKLHFDALQNLRIQLDKEW